MAVLATESVATPHARNPLPIELIERLFERIGEVSTLPTAAQRIIALADDPKTGTDDLLEVVRSDPALAMRVMRTVNSSAFGLASKVGDLKQAITLIGFEELRNLAMTAYVAPIFAVSRGHESYSRDGLWNHMVSTALVSRMLARITRRVSPQEAYLAGLLHDMGYVFLDQYVHDPFCRVIDAMDHSAPTWQVELRLMGFDHAALGGHVAAKWNLPESHVAAIRCHHLPEACDGPAHLMACVVALADFFCHRKEISSLGSPNASTPGPELFDALGLTRTDMDNLLTQLDHLLTAAQGMAAIQVQ